MKYLILIIFALVTFVGQSQVPEYPSIPDSAITDTLFDIPVPDHYLCFENPGDLSSRTWIGQENKLADKILHKAAVKYNSYVAIDRYYYVKYSNPIKDGKYYFTYAYYNDYGVPGLFYQKTLNDQPSLLVDPNFISSKDKIIFRNHSVSKDSKYLAFAYSRNGSDKMEVRVLNILTGKNQSDHLKGVISSGISWKDDGFFYYGVPSAGHVEPVSGKILYHRLGTSQSEDEVIFMRPGNTDAMFSVKTTPDERFMILTETDYGKNIKNVFYIDYESEFQSLRPLLTRLEYDDDISIIGNRGDELLALTHKNGNNGMLVKINPANPRSWKILIPEYKSALLLDVKLLNDKIITVYQSNRKQQIIFFDYDSNVLNAIELPFGFSVSGFNGEPGDKEVLFSYSGYTQPKIVYVMDTENYKMRPLQATVVNFDFGQFETRELEYESFDGTKVPMFMIYKKDLDLTVPNPTLMEAYGGFGVIDPPSFDPGKVHFLIEGGIYVFANIRGGGDKGPDWFEQGRGKNKMNSFKDFISAAEYLIQNGYTSPEKLGITGASNGGLVVGVAITRRPDLFKVAVPVAAPFDIIKTLKRKNKIIYLNEYGDINSKEGMEDVLAYSPLQNIKEDVNYPAILIMTSENDDRVPPFNSYKFAARLQNRASQKNPVILRVEKNAGHYGVEESFTSMLKEEADMYNFILYYLNE